MNTVTNDVYQAAVRELEAVLSPRVVSRSLKEGLRQLGRSPETADLATIEQILKVQVYRQLQVSMPVTDAKTAISDIVERLRHVTDQQLPQGAAGSASTGLAAQAERLEGLQVALRPFNLYFEWPEVQKLRAQVQLLEAEHDSGREAHALGLDAEAQLELVVQKLEDQLVMQARELGELREALDQVRSLGGQKVRRLETLVNQIAGSQQERQLAPAEIERARRLARDLRKLMESSVYAEQVAKGVDLGDVQDRDHESTEQTQAHAHASAFAIDVSAGEVSQPEQDLGGESAASAFTTAEAFADEGLTSAGHAAADQAGTAEAVGQAPDMDIDDVDVDAFQLEGENRRSPTDEGILDVDSEEEDLLSIDTSVLDPEVHQRLRLLDLAAELHDIAALEKDYAELFNYLPGLAQRVAELRAEVEAERTVSEVLGTLKDDLVSATSALREDLREELEELTQALGDVRPEIDSSELSQAARVTLGILSTALPSLADVEHVRQLSRLVREQEEALLRADEAMAAQLKGQNDLLARLEGTLVRYESGATASEDLERLRGELTSLRMAQEKQTLVPEVMASARQVEERIAMALAERATEASERRRARLEALRAQVEGLPVTATLSDRAEAARREIDRLLAEQAGSEAASALLFDDGEEVYGPELSLTEDDADIDVIDTMIETIRKEAGGSIRRRLQELAEEAAEVGSARLVERLQAALNELDDGHFPELSHLTAALQQEREAARLEQVGELHRLVRAAAPYQSIESADAAALAELLSSQKLLLDEGRPANRLGEAAAVLERVESEWSERLASVPTRLDTAMVRFDEVAKLNSDDVATVRRILTHLDSQRESLPRVSLGLRLQLEASLSQAERLLETLSEEYEATRVIADQLVSEGLLDDVFGSILGGDSGALSTPRETAADRASASAEAEAAATRDRELVQRYAESHGVVSATLFDEDGVRLTAPGSDDETADDERTADLVAADAKAFAALSALREAADGAYPRGSGEPLAISIEAPAQVVILGWSRAGRLLRLRLDSSANLAVMLGRVRRDLPDLD